MYELFDFDKREKAVVGYHFHCENPNHVLCIVHGVGEHAGRYDRMAGYLKKEGIAAVSMDLRGHGRSTGKRGNAAPRREVLYDIDALIEYAKELYPNVPIVLYGHSMGGNIVLDYKQRGDKNGVPVSYIVSAPWIELVQKVTGPLYGVVKVCSKLAPQISINSACNEEDLGNPKFVKPYKEDPLVHDHVTMLCAYEALSIGEALAKGKLPSNGNADNKPLLLMHGTADKICSIEGTRKIAKLQKSDDFEYIEWPNYYHEIHNGGPNATGEEVILKIIEFIKRY